MDIRPGEWALVAGSFFYFFFVLASYYTIRPLRDALAVSGGVDQMQYLFTATLFCMIAIVPLYGWLTSRIARRFFLPLVYGFFIANLLCIQVLFQSMPDSIWLARGFFVWVSIFNLFVVSVFWSFMADLFDTNQARRLFGVIAAGGSAGALAGPFLVRTLLGDIGISGLPLLSATLLSLALICLLWLISKDRKRQFEDRRLDPSIPIGGSIIAGAKLAVSHRYLTGFVGYIFLGTLTGSMLYFQQAQVISDHFSTTEEVTAIFANLDLAANSLTVLIQIAVTARLLGWLGMATTLALLPVLALAGFAVISFAPVLALVVAITVLRRAVLFGVANPTAGMLFTVVGPESKYKFKHFADTVIYRAGDSTGGWVFAGLMAAGAGMSGVAIAGMAAAGGWIFLARWLGGRYHRMRERDENLP
ncbi:MAG: MFS transporter [Xanthomonadales bacterium]|nr:MFS transporter [Xanthomonadales bacterium]